jgi:putative tricarboxylic transport membrane protein
VKDIGLGLLLVALAAGYAWATTDIPASILDDPVGAGGFPRLLAATLAVLGMAIAARGAWAVARKRVAVEEVEALDWAGPILLAVGAGYVLVAPYIGYVAALTLLMIGVAFVAGAARSWRVPATALALSAAFWVLFVKIMGASQPLPAFLYG